MPDASAAAPPPVDPPALFEGSHGLRVRPNTSLNVLPPAANSGQFVLPMITAPASRRRRTTSASFGGDVIGIERRAERRAQSGDRRHILDADGEPAQQSRIFAAREPSIELTRVIHRLRVVRDHGVDLFVELPDAVEAGPDRVGHGDLSSADPPAQFRRRRSASAVTPSIRR